MSDLLSKKEIKDIVVPNLDSSCENVRATISNGNGDPIDVDEVVRQFFGSYRAVVDAAKKGKKLPESFFVPDLWHITKGSSKLLPDAVGEQLWDASVMALKLARTLYKTCEKTKQNNYPGELYS